MIDYMKYFGGFDINIKFDKSSGKLDEDAFKEIYELEHYKGQSKNSNNRYDFETNHIIYEIKNYLYDSVGTADEKLLYSCWKYMNERKDIIIVLCANMEYKFEKQLQIFVKVIIYII